MLEETEKQEAQETSIEEKRVYADTQVSKMIPIFTLRQLEAASEHKLWVKGRPVDESICEVDCPYCGEVHTHSLEEGHRIAHCGDHRPAEERGFGYCIELPRRHGDK